MVQRLEMTPDSTASEEKGGRSYWGFVIWPVVAVMVYVLSIGPVAFLIDKGLVSGEALVIYWPLQGAIEQSHLHKPFYKYVGLWVSHPSDVWYEYYRTHLSS
jgi:hypothetical protein